MIKSDSCKILLKKNTHTPKGTTIKSRATPVVKKNICSQNKRYVSR